MSIARLAFYALGVLAASAIFAGCSTGGSQSSGLALTARSIPLRSEQHTSWISPEIAGAPRRLFVSDLSTNEVDIFTLPALVLAAQVPGFDQPHGMCAGNGHPEAAYTPHAAPGVWVTNTGTHQIIELSRDGTIIATLTDPDGYPFGCDVDAASGDLAVTNIDNFYADRKHPSGPGETVIYPGGVGPAYSVSNPAQYYYNSAAYQSGGGDPSAGALYVDGRTHSGNFILSVLPGLSVSAMHTITITGGTIHYPGMLQWDTRGNYLAIGDRRCGHPRTTCVYHVRISGSTGTIVGRTRFKAYNGHLICDMAQGVIGAYGLKYFAGGDYESCGYATSSVERWHYPSGHIPTNFNHSVVVHPFGTAISTQ